MAENTENAQEFVCSICQPSLYAQAQKFWNSMKKRASFGVRSPWAIEKSLIPNWGPSVKIWDWYTIPHYFA